MKACILVGSLKSDIADSNTRLMSVLLARKLAKLGVKTRIIHLSRLKFQYGTKLLMNETPDDFQKVETAIRDSDMLIIATPIWWGGVSSLVQQVMERIGGFDDEYIKTGVNPLYGKIFGGVITGTSDGFQHIQGYLTSFAQDMGFTVPPECFANYAGPHDKNKLVNDEYANQTLTTASRNLFVWAKAVAHSHDIAALSKVKQNKVGYDSNY